MVFRMLHHLSGWLLLSACSITGLALGSLPVAAEPDSANTKQVQRGAPVTVNDLTTYTNVFRVYARPGDTAGPWGADRLGADILQPGDSLTFNLPTGTYDVCVELTQTGGGSDMYYYIWDDVWIGSAGYRFDITNEWDDGMQWGTCTAVTPPPVNQTRRVAVNNYTGSTTVYRLYARPTASGGWGSDLLGSSVLDPGGAWVFDASQGYYDVCVEVIPTIAAPTDTIRSYVWSNIYVDTSPENFNVSAEYWDTTIYQGGSCQGR